MLTLDTSAQIKRTTLANLFIEYPACVGSLFITSI